MDNLSVTFVVSSYLPNSLRPTLDSIEKSMRAWGASPYVVALSESSPTDYAVVEATQWAKDVQCTLVVNYSQTQRILKEALNAAFAVPEVSEADIVIITNDDVILDVSSVGYLIDALQANPTAVYAVGSNLPDPSFTSAGRRAGSWQLYVVNQLAKLLPATCVRSEGALWATRGDFAKTFRWPIGSGSIADDVEIARYVVRQGLLGLNVASATVYKIPPKGFKEFKGQTRRSQDSKVPELSNQVPRILKLRAVLRVFLAHPLSGFSYVVYRLRIATPSPKHEDPTSETWSRQASTLR